MAHTYTYNLISGNAECIFKVELFYKNHLLCNSFLNAVLCTLFFLTRMFSSPHFLKVSSWSHPLALQVFPWLSQSSSSLSLSSILPSMYLSPHHKALHLCLHAIIHHYRVYKTPFVFALTFFSHLYFFCTINFLVLFFNWSPLKFPRNLKITLWWDSINIGHRDNQTIVFSSSKTLLPAKGSQPATCFLFEISQWWKGVRQTGTKQTFS